MGQMFSLCRSFPGITRPGSPEVCSLWECACGQIVCGKSRSESFSKQCVGYAQQLLIRKQ